MKMQRSCGSAVLLVLLLTLTVLAVSVQARSRRFRQSIPEGRQPAQPLAARPISMYSQAQLENMGRDQLVDLVMQMQANASQIYWWIYNETDCGYDDVPGSCSGQTVDQCKQMCLQTTGCGGFNYPHGVLKKTDCLSHMAPAPTVNLYVMQNTPQPPPPPPPPPAYNFPPVWPLPMQYTNGSTNVTVADNGFKFSASQSLSYLTLAFQRYQPLFFPHRTSNKPSSGDLTGVQVSVADASQELQLETDESYNLTIPATGGMIQISANTVFGAMHGLETLSQLIYFSYDTQTYVIMAAPWAIVDKPRFAHREVLIDSSRHFEPVPTIKRLIDSLPYAKINVVHWHIVDEQSFPFVAPSVPELGLAGSYTPYERFSANDVEDVVAYAQARGVRVMVEIDTPGHAAAMCDSHPEICPAPDCPMPLNPATNATFDVLAKLFYDVTGGARGKGLFPDNMFHLGGDEVNTECWTNSSEISAWMAAHNLTADGAYEYFVRRVQNIAISYGRDVVGWEEIWDHFGTQLNPSTIIHQWLPKSTIAVNATSHGYRVLWSTDGVWYLDGLDTTWETMYVQEPCTGIPYPNCSLVLGGGGEMWGETVDTSDLEQTIWPRLGAIAERLWSPMNVTDPDAARARFYNFRCMLNRRGVAAAPSGNPVAREAPGGPGSCYAQ